MNVIKIDKGQSERQVLQCGVDAFELVVEQGGKLDLLLLCGCMSGSQSVVATLGYGAELNLTIVDVDNELVERTINVELNGVGSKCDIGCLALCGGEQVNQNRIVVRHNVEGCSSNQVFRSVVGGFAKVLFNGLIYVARGAQKTEAYQQSRNILLSDTAKVDTQPQLEIYADDVKCNHGAATGSFDVDAIYYMRQRGISADKARSLLLHGFCLQVVPDHFKSEVEGSITDRLNSI